MEDVELTYKGKLYNFRAPENLNDADLGDYFMQNILPVYGQNVDAGEVLQNQVEQESQQPNNVGLQVDNSGVNLNRNNFLQNLGRQTVQDTRALLSGLPKAVSFITDPVLDLANIPIEKSLGFKLPTFADSTRAVAGQQDFPSRSAVLSDIGSVVFPGGLAARAPQFTSQGLKATQGLLDDAVGYIKDLPGNIYEGGRKLFGTDIIPSATGVAAFSGLDQMLKDADLIPALKSAFPFVGGLITSLMTKRFDPSTPSSPPPRTTESVLEDATSVADATKIKSDALFKNIKLNEISLNAKPTNDWFNDVTSNLIEGMTFDSLSKNNKKLYSVLQKAKNDFNKVVAQGGSYNLKQIKNLEDDVQNIFDKGKFTDEADYTLKKFRELYSDKKYVPENIAIKQQAANSLYKDLKFAEDIVKIVESIDLKQPGDINKQLATKLQSKFFGTGMQKGKKYPYGSDEQMKMIKEIIKSKGNIAERLTGLLSNFNVLDNSSDGLNGIKKAMAILTSFATGSTAGLEGGLGFGLGTGLFPLAAGAAADPVNRQLQQQRFGTNIDTLVGTNLRPKVVEPNLSNINYQLLNQLINDENAYQNFTP